MNKDSQIPENIKDPRYREYFAHLQEVIDKQNKEISVNNQIFQILKLNYRQDLKNLVGELLAILWNDQFSCIRIAIKKHEILTGELNFAEGIGAKNEAYAYLDDQVEDQLGKPGILYISDTSKIHSIKFVSGNQFPKTILGISLGVANDNFGVVWFACENQKVFTKFESDSLIALIGTCSTVIQNCIEWNETSQILSFRNEILDHANLPILILSRDEIIFSNFAAKESFNQILDNYDENQKLIRDIWKLTIESENLITLDIRDFQVNLVESNRNSSKSIRAAFFIDETLNKKQQDYLSTVLNSLSQALRSPLNLILGSTKMLPLVGEVNGHQNEYLKGILLKAEETLNIIEDLLEINRIIENKGLKIQTESLESLVNISSSLVNHLAKQKRISIVNEISNPVEVINVDKVLFTQTLANIFEFSISQTKIDGEITLSAVKNLNKWKITIKDNSNGISQVEVDRLNSFENLHEIPPTLRLARRIIDFHQGTFLIQSDLGKGNIFIIDIPC
jgi:signal transduction histidine kinase